MKLLMVLISCIAYFAVPVFAQEPSGMDIMKEQKKRHEAAQEFESIKMVLIDSAKNKEARDLKRYAKKDGSKKAGKMTSGFTFRHTDRNSKELQAEIKKDTLWELTSLMKTFVLRNLKTIHIMLSKKRNLKIRTVLLLKHCLQQTKRKRPAVIQNEPSGLQLIPLLH
ncbi:MAG: hypothetical protein FD151_1839 [bacterium]|nr:MAG: hypothetical protein FD151_1839 [bacterium]